MPSSVNTSVNSDDFTIENEVKSDNETLKNTHDNKSLQELLSEVVPENLIQERKKLIGRRVREGKSRLRY